eukprot:2009244-Lingulodinium_polyedra.AAC.1
MLISLEEGMAEAAKVGDCTNLESTRAVSRSAPGQQLFKSFTAANQAFQALKTLMLTFGLDAKKELLTVDSKGIFAKSGMQ